MPFFSKPCFKFRKSKKKNRNTENYYIKTFNDTITPVNNEETLHQSEIKSGSSLKEDDLLNNLNHSVAAKACNDTILVTSERAEEDNNDNDSFHNTDPQNSETSVDNTQEHLSQAESYLIAQDKNSLSKNELSADIIDESLNSNKDISKQNTNKLEEAQKNETILAMEDLPIPESNNFREKMYIQKSVEIINSITVNCDVFEKIEELKALEMSLYMLRQKIKEEEEEKSKTNVQIGDTEHVNDDSHNILKISDSHRTLDSEINTPTYCNDSSILSAEKRENKNVAVSDKLNDNKQDSCEDLNIDSNTCPVNFLDGNQRASSTLPTESSKEEFLINGDKKILCDSKHERDDSLNYLKPEKDNLATIGKEDAFDSIISKVSLVENNKNKTDSNSKENKSENIVQTKVKKNKSEENDMNNDRFSKTIEPALEINDLYKLSVEKSLSSNELKASQITDKNAVAPHLDFNNNDQLSTSESAEVSAQNRSFTDANLIVEDKTAILQERNTYNSDSFIAALVVQSDETFDVKEEPNCKDYKTSECENDKKFQNDNDFSFTDLKLSEDEHHIGNDTLISEYHHSITTSDSLSLNTIQSNVKEDSDFKRYSVSCETDCIYSDKTKCNINSTPDISYTSPLKSQNQYSDNDTHLGYKSEAIITNFDSNSRLGENANSNFDSYGTVNADSTENYDAFSTKKQKQGKYNLELSRGEKISFEPFEEGKVNSNSKDFLHYLKELQNKNILLNKGTENDSVPDSRQNIASGRVQTNNNYGTELYLDDNSHLKAPSDYADESSDSDTEESSTSAVEKQQPDSPTDTQTESPPVQLKFDDFLNSEDSLYVNVEYCKDDNELSEDSEDNKSQAENISLSQTSIYSNQDDTKCQEKHSTFSTFNEECLTSTPKTCGQNQIKKLNYLQKCLNSYYENKEEIDNNTLSLKSKQKDCKNLSKRMDSSKICKQLDKKESQNGSAEGTTLEKEIHSKLSPNNLLHKKDIQLISENKRKRKSVSRYSLSDCSISSGSGNICERGDTKDEKLKTKSSDSFIVPDMGKSRADENRENNTLINSNKYTQNAQKSTKLKNALKISKKEFPKIKRGDKIKIRITKKCSSTDKDKTLKTSCNDKYTSKTNKNTIRLQSGDAIDFLSYFDQINENSQLNRIKNSNYYKIPDGIRTSFTITNGDAIEIKRKESINLFKKRKQKILSKMGPNLRIIPIKKTESFKIKSSKIEKFCLNTELNSLTEKDSSKRSLSNTQKISNFHEDNFPRMHKESSPSARNNITVQNALVPVELLYESDAEAVSDSLEKMTPIRKKILDSSRSIRSPKYLSLSCKDIDSKKTLKPIFIKSPKQKIVVAHLLNDEKDIYELKESFKIYSPDSRKYKVVSPKKNSAEYSPRPCVHHTQNYRATSPDDLRPKFDAVFKKYARRGRCNGELISYKRSTEWLRDAGVIGKLLTADEATDAFKCVAGVKIALNKGDYRQFLKKLTRVKKLNYNEVYEKLCKASTKWIVA